MTADGVLTAAAAVSWLLFLVVVACAVSRGLRRIVFAGLAAFLRWVARGPLRLSTWIAWLADRCEELAR